MKEPLPPADAKALAVYILDKGNVVFSKHARAEMKADKLSDPDAVNVIRGGVCEPGELVNGTYRYRFRTSRMYFVVAFKDKTELCVITAWKKAKK